MGTYSPARQTAPSAQSSLAGSTKVIPSPLSFTVVIDALAEAISGDPSIKGFALPGSQPLSVKAVLYADDTALPFNSGDDLTKIAGWLRVYAVGQPSPHPG